MWNDALCYQQYGAPETVLALHHLSLPPLAPDLFGYKCAMRRSTPPI